MTELDAHIVVVRPDGFAVDVELCIPAGATLALVGPNGAGKTTIVSALAGLTPLDAGHIRLNGSLLDEPPTGVFVAPDRRRIGVMFQDGLLFDHLDVRSNIAFGLNSRGMATSAIDNRVDRWIEDLGLVKVAHRRPRELSGGEVQRVALARALVIEPELLILDEPLSSLDVSTRSDVRSMIESYLAAYDRPAIVITHDPVEAFMLGDEVAIVEAGRMTHSGSPDEIRMHPTTPYAADVVGTNLVLGTARDGVVTVGSHRLRIPAIDLAGDVIVTFHPRTVALHLEEPHGSPRNVWETEIDRVDDIDSIVRVRTGEPLPVTAEVTRSAAKNLSLSPGQRVWVSVKATELTVTSAV